MFLIELFCLFFGESNLFLESNPESCFFDLFQDGIWIDSEWKQCQNGDENGDVYFYSTNINPFNTQWTRGVFLLEDRGPHKRERLTDL